MQTPMPLKHRVLKPQALKGKLLACLILPMLVSLGACDYFVRFAQTKYQCSSNPLGINMVERQKRSGTERVIVTVRQRDLPGILVLSEEGWHTIVDDLSVNYNSKSQRFSAVSDGNYYSLSCTEGDGFSM